MLILCMTQGVGVTGSTMDSKSIRESSKLSHFAIFCKLSLLYKCRHELCRGMVKLVATRDFESRAKASRFEP